VKAAAALVLYLLGLGLAFGWRSVIQWRRTGDTGLRLDAGPPGTVAWWAKLLFIAALVLGLAGPITALAGLPAIDALDHTSVQAGGLLIAVAGVLTTVAAQLHMGASWRVGVDHTERTTLITSGAFRLARNPIFTAMTVTSAGMSLLVPNIVSIAATAVLIASVQLQVRAVEEPYLARTHGNTYAAYAARVGRFLPRIGRRSHAGTPPVDNQ